MNNEDFKNRGFTSNGILMNSLVLDVGTTNIKAIIFDASFKIVSSVSKEISTKTENGKVEQNPKEILLVSKDVIKRVVEESKVDPKLILGWGMTVQRETIVVWNKETGEPVYPAISWQDNRTSELCERIKESQEKLIREKTGLLITPYFSASKLAWIFKQVGNTKGLIWGTVDTWIMWNLLKGKPYVTDYTNASRTMLFNINNLSWDEKLFNVWGIKIDNRPLAKPSLSKFGTLDESIIDISLELVAVSGDQQASMYGALKRDTETKITFGTGTFLVQRLKSGFSVFNNFFTTLLPTKNGASYAIEAKIGEFGQMVAHLLEQKLSLENITKEIALSVAPWIKSLPVTPKSIVVDGGITQSPFLLEALRKNFGDIAFIEQPTFEGTALGAAFMVFDSLNGEE